MKIAILGWGSLIWNPGNLGIDKNEGKNGWFDDGPMLPIEFARISKGPRLTLVILPGSEEVKTLYAISNLKKLEQAISNLRERESCNIKSIGVYNKLEKSFSDTKFPFKKNIETWMERQKEIEAILWTDLPGNFQEKTGLKLSEENAITYLNSVLSSELAEAENYIRRTPTIVETPIRKIIEQKLGWNPIIT